MKVSTPIKQKISDASGIPKDVTMGIPLLTILGDIEINLENYGGIIEYTNNLVRVRTKAGQIIINGKRLHIEYYTNDDMKIHGIIDSIEFKHLEG